MKFLPYASRRRQIRPWRVVALSIGILIVVLVVAGVFLVRENERVLSITQQALRYDIEIEDEGDDLRVAVLDLRHFQRDIMYEGPSNAALSAFDQGYANLLEELDDLELLGLSGLEVMQPAEIRELAARYYEDFRAAAGIYSTDRDGFEAAASEGLRRIEELDRAVERIDDTGEILAANSLERVLRAAEDERVALVGLLAAVVIVGIIAAISAGRLLSRLEESHRREEFVADELARALRQRTDFIADVSHELRTPLTVIRGNAEIGMATPGEAVHRDVLSEISLEANRMSRLVDDLLFLARSDAGRPPLDLEYVSARWLVTRLERPADVLARQRGACLETDFQGDGFLEVDQTRIEQALLILIDNAARYGASDSCVRLSTRIENGELAITVADRGQGIPSAELPMIFDRFYRVRDGRTRKKNGSGLGLAIAKTIVDAHQGSISAESRVGAGTTMTIRLPLHPGLPEEQPETEPTEVASPA